MPIVQDNPVPPPVEIEMPLAGQLRIGKHDTSRNQANGNWRANTAIYRGKIDVLPLRPKLQNVRG